MKHPLIEIDIKPRWTIRYRGKRQFDFVLVDLLQAINDTGRLTDAAQRTGISYRHAWNVIENWGAFFGKPLVVMARGRGTRITPLGEKLLWAGKRVQARLTPQLESLSSDLARVLNEALTSSAPALRMHASHDYAVAILRDLLNRGDKIRLELQYQGSIDALASLRHGGCELAGFHIAEGAVERDIMPRYAKWIDAEAHRLIRFVTRTQGFIVPPGNPKRVKSIADLAQPNVRFVNRQRGSGTRTLLEQMLAHAGIDRARIDGFENEEFTHAAVAALVAGRLADVGFGVQAAAKQFHLDFIPIVTERYFLLCQHETLEHPTVRDMLTLMRGEEFRRLVAQLPGYSADRSGEIALIADTLPQAEFHDLS